VSRRAPRARKAAAATAAAAAIALTVGAISAAHAQENEDGHELLVNGDFAEATGDWWLTEGLESTMGGGSWCIEVPGGTTNPWDAIVGQSNIPLHAGESYVLEFTASAQPSGSIRALMQLSQDPWTTEFEEVVQVGPDAKQFAFGFTADNDWDDLPVTFQIGGVAHDWELCFERISFRAGAAPPAYSPDTGPDVRVNQHGYFANGPKFATVVSDAANPLDFELRDAGGNAVFQATTSVHGYEATAELNVHVADFSDFTGSGAGFTLAAIGQTSYPFAISANPYEDLAVDALSFYYTQRSGIEILDSIAPGYGRPAGHLDVAPNQGDSNIACFEGHCDYTLDLTRGWYDAGDHGKYSVPGGISVHQVMGVWERALHAPTGDTDRLADGSLRIPEHGNGVPDVLDEARWHLEFMLAMQVPDGQPLAGMAHHKMHDENWTGLPLLPHQNPEPRYVHPPSTAATLNLAATGAQCARLYEPFDAAFAQRCLTAAEKAWKAAHANPDRFAPADSWGGGPYDDTEVDDEFYWAAAELYLTTGESVYEDFLLDHELHYRQLIDEESFSWLWVAPLAHLQLALVPNDLPDRDRIVDLVLEGADNLLGLQESSPWHLTYGFDGVFVWGSSASFTNNMVALAVAYDVSGDESYLEGVIRGMDYMLGRNALNHSYITDYGTKFSHNMHSRWYANELDPSLPNPPSGSLAGGSNTFTETWDPYAQRYLPGCAPQACYIDSIQSWSTNELTINWNSTLSWVANFLADQDGVSGKPGPGTGPGTGSGDGGEDDERLATTGSSLTVLLVTSAALVAAAGALFFMMRRRRVAQTWE
jgi:endoglucanase